MSQNVIEDDLRGSAPVYSAKDILQKLDRKVDEMDSKLDTAATAMSVLVSQDLNERLTRVESWKDRITGFAYLGPLLGAAAILWQIARSVRIVEPL